MLLLLLDAMCSTKVGFGQSRVRQNLYLRLKNELKIIKIESTCINTYLSYVEIFLEVKKTSTTILQCTFTHIPTKYIHTIRHNGEEVGPLKCCCHKYFSLKRYAKSDWYVACNNI